MERKTKRIAGFDIIRLLACLFVCLVHFNASVCGYQNGTFVYPNSIAPNFLFGYRVYLGTLGVNLFFIVSGASLMLSYKPEDKAIVFYKKRMLNIYPSFWIAFTAATLIDFFRYKGMANAQPLNLLISFAGLDGYLSVLNLIPWEYYKLGDWFLGCILLLYIGYPLIYKLLVQFPKTTCGCFAVLYVASLYAVQKRIPIIGSSDGITICACGMFLGMAYIRFGLYQNKKTFIAAVAAFLTALLLGDKVPSDFLALAFAFLLVEIAVILADKIRSDAVKDKLLAASGLTYPIFLVHHYLCGWMVQGFDLANMPRLYVYVLFVAYTAGTLLLASALKKYGDRLGNWMRGRKPIVTTACVMLLLSYGYTLFRVIQYRLSL